MTRTWELSNRERNQIVVTPEPNGKFEEGYLSESVAEMYPGQHITLDATLPEIEKRGQYKVYDAGTPGDNAPIMILLPDTLQGKTVYDSYKAGDRVFFYIPEPGDELMCYFANVGTGTGTPEEDITRGSRLSIENNTGNIVSGTGDMQPYTALETVNDIVEDTLVLCKYAP